MNNYFSFYGMPFVLRTSFLVLKKYKVPRCSLRDDGKLGGEKRNTRFLATLEIDVSP